MFSLIPWRKERKDVEAGTEYRDPLSLFRSEFDSLFDRFLGTWPTAWRNLPEMPVPRMEETDKEIVCKLDAPGFDAKDFNVELTEEQLKVVAEHKEDKGEGKEVCTRRVEEYLLIPKQVDREKVEAIYRNGVLEVRLPKGPEAQGKKIEVKV